MQKHSEISRFLRDAIESGELQPGQRLMTEAQIREKFGVCRQTVRRALKDLEEEKLIYSIQGSGSYVSKPGGIKRARFGRIAVITTYLDNYIFPMILHGVEKALSEAGYVTQIAFTDNRISNEKRILEQIIEDKNIDGLIVEPSRSVLPNPNVVYYNKLLEYGVPVVFFNDSYRDVKAPCVRLDDRKAAEKMTNILLHAGHTKIGAILKLDDAQGMRRYEGFMDAMTAAGAEFEPENVVWIDTVGIQNLSIQSDSIFHRIKDCTGVLCYNDLAARQVIDMAFERGIDIPGTLSLVSIDDAEVSEYGKVGLTSMPHPKEALGVKAAEMLLKCLDDPSYNEDYLFETEPIHRASVQRVK